MKVNPKISAAVAAILSAPTAIVFAAPPDQAEATAAGGALTEVIVTAEKRTENIQDVPITMQVLSAQTLSQLNVTTFDDFIKYLPNVTQSSWGPGASLIFMRGLSTGALGTQGSGTDANFPNVAVYLDDQSAMMPYRNLDVYAVDMERVEVLEGPQGTLFGGGAEAGAIRYITNKPKLDKVEGAVNAMYGTTAHGDPNAGFDATLNLPLVQDTLAFRAVIYGERRGGYINNVPQTFTRNNADLGIGYADYAIGCSIGHPTNGQCPAAPNQVVKFGVPPGSEVINNQANVRNAINPVDYTGIRGSLLWKINDDWNFLVTQNYQSLDAEGVFYQMPRGSDYEFNQQPLPDLSVTMFNPSYSKDKFEITTWTLNGQIGWLKAIYAGGYVDRNLESQSDYTNYTRGYFADFYQCTTHPLPPKGTVNPNYTHYGVPGPTSQCYSPNAWWHNTQQNKHLSHELRFSTPDDWRARALLGGYLEQFRVYDNTDWFYKTVPPCTQPAAPNQGCLTNLTPPPGATINNPATRPDNESFFDDVQRGYKQYAFFGSFDFDILPKVLTVTAGTRHYNFHNTQTGSNVSSFGCQNNGPPPSLCGTNNLNALNLDTTETGNTSRANVTWHITPDVMAYYTWSQGYRPGGFNRSSSGHLPFVGTSIDAWYVPQYYHPDKLTNNEVGLKSEWLDHHLLVNGTLYQEDWKNTQIQFFNPAALGNLSFVDNGADYRVRGFELQVAWRVVGGLTIDGSASWNSSSQQNNPALVVNSTKLAGTPYEGDVGKPISQYACPASPANPTGVCQLTNVFGVPGSPLAQSPSFQGNIRIRYDWQTTTYAYFAQISGTHTGSTLANVGIVPPIAPVGSTHINYTDPGYSTLDAALGMSKDQWTAQIYGQNLTDERGIVFTSASQAIETQTVIRPRVLGVRVGYRF
jgi:outer membrane receptor protein involved in Fe transport